MTYISQQDLDVRLQLSGCKFSELINTYIQDLKWGRKCSEKRLSDLILLNAYIELLECYQVAVVEGPTVVEYDNCITETQALKMLDNISKLYKLCFQSLGFTYTSS